MYRFINNAIAYSFHVVIGTDKQKYIPLILGLLQ